MTGTSRTPAFAMIVDALDGTNAVAGWGPTPELNYMYKIYS